MARVRLIHWKAAEAASLLAALHKAGYEVEYEEHPDYHFWLALKGENR